MLITVLVKPKMYRMFTDILSVFFRPEPAEGYACITIAPPFRNRILLWFPLPVRAASSINQAAFR